MRSFILALGAAVLALPALAAEPAAPEPTQAALVQMLQEARGREATALVQRNDTLAKVAAEKRRADAAGARLKEAEKAAETPKP